LNSVVGGHCGRGTPGPIPNPVAKPSSADGTALARVWESRSPPTFNMNRKRPGLHCPGRFLFSGFCSGRLFVGCQGTTALPTVRPAGCGALCACDLGSLSVVESVPSRPVPFCSMPAVGRAVRGHGYGRHVAQVSVTSHLLQGLRGRRTVCEVERNRSGTGTAVKRGKARLGRDSARRRGPATPGHRRRRSTDDAARSISRDPALPVSRDPAPPASRDTAPPARED
jgi:hypothetical protein